MDGATYFRASPLVFVLHYKWSGSQWGYDAANSWAASSQYGQSLDPNYSSSTKMLTISYKGLKFPHVQMQYVTSQRLYTAQMCALTKDSCQVRIVHQNGNLADSPNANDELYFYGYRFT